MEDLSTIPFYEGRSHQVHNKWGDTVFKPLEMLYVQANDYCVGDFCLIKAINLAVGSVWFDTLQQYLRAVSKDGYR